MTTLYKVTNTDGSAFHGGRGKWHKPQGKRPGKWMPAIPNPVAGERGYHVVTVEQLFDWFGPKVWTVEVRGTVIDGGDRMVAEQARLIAPTLLDERRQRLFAADCAERVLHIYERRNVSRATREAIEVARRFADGDATRADLAAARDAAWAAAGDAAWAAAGDAAWAAARDAAWAWAATRAAERAWQVERLRLYLHSETVPPLDLPETVKAARALLASLEGKPG